ncbi:neuropeptide FF receptor 2-like [Babylonia areolata]|uniref:neuropeptide FF receptor 2-like n=1 Tax=Babylonia areolata TaxID=304850 RepID=UPI003FD4FEC7
METVNDNPYHQVLYQHSRNAAAAAAASSIHLHQDLNSEISASLSSFSSSSSSSSPAPYYTLFLSNHTDAVFHHTDSGGGGGPGEAPPNVTYYPLVKQPAYMIGILSVAYGLVLILALLGNACVLAIVVRDKRFHSATFVFIANLAVADLLVAIFCNPITLMSNIFNGWRFGAFMCKAAPYLQGVSVCASVNTLAAIAVDRYLAICHVLKVRMTMSMARLILGVVWLVAATIMVPWAVFYQQQTFSLPHQDIPICVQAWPNSRQAGEFFLGAIFLFCYALPLSFIVCCYFLIGWRVWNRDAPGITTERGVIQKSKIRVVKMLAVVVLLFALSWLPLYVVNLIVYFFNPGDQSPEIQIIHDSVIPVAQWLGTSNSCMNPLVYCLFSKRIRERIRLMVTCSSSRSEARRAFLRYSSTRHMTVDYCNGQVKLAFRTNVSPNRRALLTPAHSCGGSGGGKAAAVLPPSALALASTSGGDPHVEGVAALSSDACITIT